MDNQREFRLLVAIMDRLRGPGGCPWDREQTYASLRGYLLEECYEVADAIDAEDPTDLCEELGDLLFQIVFLSRLAKEDRHFTIDDVIRGISDKMTRRHPHVFGSENAETSAEVLRKWEKIKRHEKQGQGPTTTPTSVLEGVPRALPALARAHRLGTRAARVGFDWEDPLQILDKIDEEIAELRQALRSGALDATRTELGDVLFSIAMLGRRLGVDPEAALERSNRKFIRRFRSIEEALAKANQSIEETPPERLEQLWVRAKAGESDS